MAYQFTPVQTFEAQVNGKVNRYLKDGLYTCRDGALYADLDKKAKQWASEGLVRILGDVPNTVPIRMKVKEEG